MTTFVCAKLGVVRDIKCSTWWSQKCNTLNSECIWHIVTQTGCSARRMQHMVVLLVPSGATLFAHFWDMRMTKFRTEFRDNCQEKRCAKIMLAADVTRKKCVSTKCAHNSHRHA